MKLILYSKPGCHLCEGLQEKLEQIGAMPEFSFKIEIRDITTREDWYQRYEYEIPVLFVANDTENNGNAIERMIPRPSPRASVKQLAQILQKYL
ncbi:MAG: glutaredoxin family protein [Calothrix sp. C42_A2020_038]|nr:glutaredoxin family protein [Calothrix sp. C42_A2020_038]